MSLIATFQNILRLDGSNTTHSRGNMPDSSPHSWNGHTNGKSKPRALSDQIGGQHYKEMAIQPVEYIEANGIGFSEGCIIKYVSRWRQKGGVEDLKKARHFLDMMIEREGNTALGISGA